MANKTVKKVDKTKKWRIEAFDRLLLYIEYLNKNPTNFGRELNISGSQMSSMKKGIDIGISHVSIIIERYSELNLYWWLFGKGEMLLQNNELVDNSELPNLEDVQNIYRNTEDIELAEIKRDIEMLKIKYFDIETKLNSKEV